ncbi:hypothetical protein TDB9533_04719 [Thalassocella blandensis]|nr:hypothetical protein TDB9533_04719 [Thalassocella blandensis]
MNINCHCQNICIDVDTPAQLTQCNCSICRRYQALWAYYTPEDVHITVGSAGEAFYCWGDKEIEFVRCAQCGCVTHYRSLSSPRIAVNFNMLENALISEIPIRHFDGKTRL